MGNHCDWCDVCGGDRRGQHPACTCDDKKEIIMVRLVTIASYDEFSASTDQGAPASVGEKAYPLYLSNALAGEAGETANKIKKMYRDDNGEILADRREDALFELGDCVWYISRLARKLGSSLEEVLNMNRDKLTQRVQTGTLTGVRGA